MVVSSGSFGPLDLLDIQLKWRPHLQGRIFWILKPPYWVDSLKRGGPDVLNLKRGTLVDIQYSFVPLSKLCILCFSGGDMGMAKGNEHCSLLFFDGLTPASCPDSRLNCCTKLSVHDTTIAFLIKDCYLRCRGFGGCRLNRRLQSFRCLDAFISLAFISF